jgi:hypothetical protein
MQYVFVLTPRLHGGYFNELSQAFKLGWINVQGRKVDFALPNEFVRIQRPALRMLIRCRILIFAVLCLAWVSKNAWAAGSCHIHPLGIDMKEAESRIIEWYSSLDDCEMANKKLFGGRGTCHYFLDGLFNGRGDSWRSRLKDYGTPQDLPSE